MRHRLLAAALCLASPLALCHAQSNAPKATDLRSVLLEQMHSTQDKAEWFVPLNTAVAGLTPEQARWTPKSDAKAGASTGAQMHSVAQLVAHLVFWNERALAQIKHQPLPKFSGNNEESFVGYDVNQITAAEWSALTARLDHCLSDYDQWIQSATDAQLAASASAIAHISSRNAYHTGEIVYVRKLQGSWDPSKGVK